MCMFLRSFEKAKRTIATSRCLRRLLSADPNPLIQLLLKNPELDENDARSELRWIRQHIVQSASSGLITVQNTSNRTEARVRGLCERRATGEPLQYVLGTTDFGPLTLYTRAPVLVPRPETAYITERLANHILEHNSSGSGKSKSEVEGLDVVDFCTGSGCIALLLAHLLGRRVKRIRGYDISPEAIKLARKNVLHVDKDIGRVVEMMIGDIFDPELVREIGKVDVVVSNPPYISSEDWEDLPRGVKEYEDQQALLGDAQGEKGDGLAFYRRMAEILPSILKPGGMVAVEVGHRQAREVTGILQDHGGMKTTEVWRDQFDQDRMVIGWYA